MHWPKRHSPDGEGLHDLFDSLLLMAYSISLLQFPPLGDCSQVWPVAVGLQLMALPHKLLIQASNPPSHHRLRSEWKSRLADHHGGFDLN